MTQSEKSQDEEPRKPNAIQVVAYDGGEVVRTIQVGPGRNIDRVERGVEINLSEDFYTRQVSIF